MKHIVHTKGHYGIEDPELKLSKKGMQEDSDQRTKVQKAQKCSWHGNEEQKDNIVYYLLQYCGVQAKNYLRTGKINLTYLASKELFILAIFLVLPFPKKIDYFSMV